MMVMAADQCVVIVRGISKGGVVREEEEGWSGGAAGAYRWRDRCERGCLPDPAFQVAGSLLPFVVGFTDHRIPVGRQPDL